MGENKKVVMKNNCSKFDLTDDKLPTDCACIADYFSLLLDEETKTMFAICEGDIDNKIESFKKWEKAQKLNGISEKQPTQKLKELDIEIE